MLAKQTNRLKSRVVKNLSLMSLLMISTVGSAYKFLQLATPFTVPPIHSEKSGLLGELCKIQEEPSDSIASFRSLS